MIIVASEDPATDDAGGLLAALSRTLASITGDSGEASFDAEEVRGPLARFVVARTQDGVAVGCGAFRPLQRGVAELKRMYATPGTQGVGRAILAHLEVQATALGYEHLWLETRQVNTRAIAFYERHGYHRIANFGKYVGNAEAVCLGKPMQAAASPS